MKNKLLLIPLILASINAYSKDFIDISTFPKWFKDAAAREANVKTKSKLDIPELNVSTQVAGPISHSEKGDGFWYITYDLGTVTPIECYVFTSFDGAANSMHSIVDYALEASVELNKKALSSRSNFALDVGLMGTTPYIAYDVLYTLGEGNQKVAGIAKAISAQTSNSLQICLHNEIGYRDTFYKISESFVNAIASAETSNTFFEPVYSLSLNGMKVGFSREKYSLDADGDVYIQRAESMVIPVDASSIMRSDNAAESWSTKQGALFNVSQTTIENGEISLNVSLNMSEGIWAVKGQMQGKDINVELEHKEWLLSDYGSYLAGQSLLDSNEATSNYNMWIPNANPGAASPVTFSKIKDNEQANLTIKMGPIEVNALADQQGIIQQGSLSQGPVNLELELIQVKGTPILE